MERITERVLQWLAAVTILLVSGTITAGETERRELGAHEHGHGILTVAMDGNDLVIELEIPAVNVVGFEHAPKTDAQRHAIEVALEIFRHGDALFVPTAAAECGLNDVDVALGGISHKEHSEKGHQAEHQAEHEKEHAQEGDEERHSELHGAYHFHCEMPDQLASLQVRIFDHLIDVDELDVQVVTPTIQAALELKASPGVLILTRK